MNITKSQKVWVSALVLPLSYYATSINQLLFLYFNAFICVKDKLE